MGFVRSICTLALIVSVSSSKARAIRRGGGSVTNLQLVLVSLNQRIELIHANQVIHLDDLPGTSLSIEAMVSGKVESVRFGYNRNPNFHTETSAPFAMCGDSRGKFAVCGVLGVGSHTATATPFSQDGGTRIVGTSLTVNFTIVAGSAMNQVTSPTSNPQLVTTAPFAVVTSTPVASPMALAASCKAPKGGIIGSDMIVVSGFTNGYGQATPASYALDLNNPNALWRRMDDIPITKGITHGAVTIVGTKLYICGGFVGGHPGPHVDSCFVYDHTIAPGSGKQWSAIPPLPEGRAGGGMVYSQVRNALIYAAGSERPKGNTYVDYHHTWMLELGGTTGWVTMHDIPFSSNHMSSVSAVDHLGAEHFFFLGGQMGENEKAGNVDDNYEWDATHEVWTERTKMPFARGHASMSTRAISCGFIIAAGTTNESGKTKDISYYDIPSDTWTKVGALPRTVNTPVCDIDFVNGYLYCVSGLVTSRFSVRIRIQV